MTCTHEGLQYEAQYDAYRCSQCGKLIPQEDLKNSPPAVPLPGASAPIPAGETISSPGSVRLSTQGRNRVTMFDSAFETFSETVVDQICKGIDAPRAEGVDCDYPVSVKIEHPDGRVLTVVVQGGVIKDQQT